MSTLERDIEQGLRRMVEQLGGVCLKWVCPGWAGVPDRIILLPGGRVVFVETKRPNGGRTAALQRYWAGKLRALGCEHYWVRTQDDIYDLRDRLEEGVPAEEILGRPLAPGEVVHHINGDKRDNRPENLKIYASQAEHMSEGHSKARR